MLVGFLTAARFGDFALRGDLAFLGDFLPAFLLGDFLAAGFLGAAFRLGDFLPAVLTAVRIADLAGDLAADLRGDLALTTSTASSAKILAICFVAIVFAGLFFAFPTRAFLGDAALLFFGEAFFLGGDRLTGDFLGEAAAFLAGDFLATAFFLGVILLTAFRLAGDLRALGVGAATVNSGRTAAASTAFFPLTAGFLGDFARAFGEAFFPRPFLGKLFSLATFWQPAWPF